MSEYERLKDRRQGVDEALTPAQKILRRESSQPDYLNPVLYNLSNRGLVDELELE